MAFVSPSQRAFPTFAIIVLTSSVHHQDAQECLESVLMTVISPIYPSASLLIHLAQVSTMHARARSVGPGARNPPINLGSGDGVSDDWPCFSSFLLFYSDLEVQGRPRQALRK